MNVDLFDFDLPRERIAERPARPRDAARLLRVGPDHCEDLGIRDLAGLLRPGDVMVFNDTRVIPARLDGQRGTAHVEVTLHLREDDSCWRAFARPARKLRLGDQVSFAADFSAEVVGKNEGGEVSLRFDRGGPALMAALEAHGRLPLPPYIRHGTADATDRADYQTTYARADGAVAAPTAGLHFTDAVLTALDARGIERVAVTLHVGAGTFLPVKVADTDQHHMHQEIGLVTAEAAERINQARARGGRVVAVGTTALRLLESAASPEGRVQPFDGATDIFIVPGYRFRIVDRLMTNFHLPRSTLFMLVSAFAGLGPMRAAYAHAISAGYRFYSYGDACLLDRNDDAAQLPL